MFGVMRASGYVNHWSTSFMITTNADEFVRQLNGPNRVQQFPVVQAIQPKQAEPVPRPARWPRWMKKPEVAEYLSVSERTVDKWVKTALLPKPLHFGDHLKRWDRLTLDKHLDQKTNITAAGSNSVSNLLGAYADTSARRGV